MASSDQNHRRNRSTPQSIPLQVLSRPADDEEDGSQPGTQHRRTLSERGRNLLRRDEDGEGNWRSTYAPIAEDSPSPSRQPESLKSGAGNTSQDADDYSPLDDTGAFQSAIGFAGLTVQGDSTRGAGTPPVRSLTERRPPPLITRTLSDPYYSRNDAEDENVTFSPEDEDTTRLTDDRHLQPMAGLEPSTPTGQREDRSSFQSVRFLSPHATSPSSRLGDDLHNAESGIRSSLRARTRSLSPSTSPLHRAGTIMRNMSQRVVNLSNEPEVAEKTIRRKSSTKQARLHEPFPGLPEFTHDGSTSPIAASPIEKPPSPLETPILPPIRWETQANPLKGRSLGIFPPDSRIRTKLCDVLVHPVTEPFLLILIVIQTILLALDSSKNVYTHPRSSRWGTTWIDYGLLALFSIYTVEIIARVIVSGFIVNPVEYSTINRQIGFKQAVINKGRELFALHRQDSSRQKSTGLPDLEPQQPSILRSFTTQMNQTHTPEQVNDSRHRQRIRLAHRAFLRHSFNRLDFVAVVSFWISFTIGIFGVESNKHEYVFRMLSCLRILRLLGLTSGTTVILRSLKKAAPLLVNVAFLISFFWLLFAIIGLQSFKSSLRRTCVWVDPEHQQENFTSNGIDGDFQFCGGYLDSAGNAVPWIYSDGRNGTTSHKGFLCPVNSFCVEGDNPYDGTISFDNIFQSLQLVFVIMSSNTWSDVMYYLMDSDYLAAALFFAAGIIIMSLWLINLLIAVITSSFQVIRDESKASAFTGQESEPVVDDERANVQNLRESHMKRLYDRTSWVWVAVIVYGLLCQALRSASMSKAREKFIDVSETGVTIVLLIEIIIRFIVDWRNFFHSKRNLFDLLIAIITTVIQAPSIKSAHNGRAYAWLTVFQILRFYRVVLAIPLTRDLIMIVFGNVNGLLNLILFVFLLTFLAAIFAAQLFRGELPSEDQSGETIVINFATIYNAFIGMYQILSSENWTTIMYNITDFDKKYDTAWIGAAFCIIWFIFANLIVLNMFIAVIQENFDVSEDEKRLQQVKAFLQQKEHGVSQSNLSLSTIFKLGGFSGRRRDPLDFGSAAAEMLLKDAVVRDFLDEHGDGHQLHEEPPTLRPAPTVVFTGTLSSWWGRMIRKITHREPNPFYSHIKFSRAYEDLDVKTMAKEAATAQELRKRAQREYLRKHPNYNVSLFLFKPDHPIRRICQRVVGPGRGGERIEGVGPSVPVWYTFSAFIYAAIVAMVLLACVTTPLYQREYFLTHDFSVKNWFVFTDMGFAILFTVEAIIKVIADGFFWTPNAYFRGSWGFIDGIVLITLWINVATSLYNEGEISRAVGAFKALRALRLLNVSDSARDHFHSVIVQGGWKVLSAAFVSLSLLFPFAIYGVNLFAGRFEFCNDGDSGITDLNNCVGEYNSTPFAWDVLAPRQVSNPYYDFDNFGDSLFILFQIVSQEGWVDVMASAESVTGVFTQPREFASQGNAIFFVIFNLLGAVFVLTLFVSVFMRNYTEQTGVAYLTTDQRSWLELRKLLRQVSPSKRPSSTKKRETWEEWCYRRAVRKTGRWHKFITLVLIFHVVLLCLEFYPEPIWWERMRDALFFLLTLIYIANVVIRIIGLGWTRFRKSSWDVYSLFSIFGTFATTILVFTDFYESLYVQLHKLCLVSIALLLIPRNNQLDQLFKTAAASFTSIANLLATWFVLFLVYAIALTQTFGLTKFNENENGNLNFRSVPKALILLFKTSIGEGWNQIMEDYAAVKPPYCVVGQRYFDGDCGSPEWARALFISWNILSMYIFVNLFVSLIYESFSYVYQRSSGLSIISREEIRRFKQAWAEFDPHGTGYISKEAFPRLLGELSGVFEMRIYDGDFTVNRLIEDCSIKRRDSELPVEGHEQSPDIDIDLLNRRLADLPVQEIRRRRQRMNIFYEEVLVSSDPDKGIAFNSLLMILAHYKVINDNKSLRLEEFLRRRARLARVEEAVRRSVVIGFFDTLYWSRQFRKYKEAKSQGRMTAIPQFTVPEIFVDDEDITDAGRARGRRSRESSRPSPPFWSIDLSENRQRGSNISRSRSPPFFDLGSRSRSGSIQFTPQDSPTRATFRGSETGNPDWQLAQALGASGHLSEPPSPLEPGAANNPEAGRSSQNSATVSALDVENFLDNSAWGESIRRSFTMRRQPSK